MKFSVALIAVGLLAAFLACQGEAGPVVITPDTPIPQSTNTPHPTLDVVPTPTPQPTYTAQPASEALRSPTPPPSPFPTVVQTLWPTFAPVEPLRVPLRGSGVFEPISSAANAEMRLGRAALTSGDPGQALVHYQRAADLQGAPSAVIKNWLAIAYRRLGQYDLSIARYTEAVALRDISLLRVGRAFVYWSNGQCEKAVADAEAALSMAPVVSEGIHTDAEAHTVLALCYMDTGQNRQTLEHVEILLPLAKAHGYSYGAVAAWEENRQFLIEELAFINRWSLHKSEEDFALQLPGEDQTGESGTWVISISCLPEQRPGVYLLRYGGIFMDSANLKKTESSVSVDVDGESLSEVWLYFPSRDGLADFYGARSPENLIGRILTAETMEITVPTTVTEWVLRFPVEGLDEFIRGPQDVCAER